MYTQETKNIIQEKKATHDNFFSPDKPNNYFLYTIIDNMNQLSFCYKSHEEVIFYIWLCFAAVSDSKLNIRTGWSIYNFFWIAILAKNKIKCKNLTKRLIVHQGTKKVQKTSFDCTNTQKVQSNAKCAYVQRVY